MKQMVLCKDKTLSQKPCSWELMKRQLLQPISGFCFRSMYLKWARKETAIQRDRIGYFGVPEKFTVTPKEGLIPRNEREHQSCAPHVLPRKMGPFDSSGNARLRGLTEYLHRGCNQHRTLGAYWDAFPVWGKKVFVLSRAPEGSPNHWKGAKSSTIPYQRDRTSVMYSWELFQLTMD